MVKHQLIRTANSCQEASRNTLYVFAYKPQYNLLLYHTKSQAQCIANLGDVLKAAGSSWENVVKVNVYLKNMDDFAAMNEVYEKCMSRSLTNHDPLLNLHNSIAHS